MDNNNRDSLKTQNVVSEDASVGTTAPAADLSSQRRKLIKASAAVVPAIMTLRSGAVAAMTSSAHRCLNNPDTPIKTNDSIDGIDGIDPVLGDDGQLAPLDEWLRVAAKPGYVVSGRDSRNFYGLRKNSSSYEWDDVLGWDWYRKRKNGELTIYSDPDDIHDKRKLTRGWRHRVAFYCVNGEHGSGDWDIVKVGKDGEGGETIDPPIPPEVISASLTQVYLLAYYNQNTGEISYYPIKQGGALLITGSCLCSIAPGFQL